MKKLLIIPFLILSIAGYSQMNTFGGIGLRVNDTTTYQTNAAAYHAAGYYDMYFNNQAITNHWDVWNGSSYDHIFSFSQALTAGGSFNHLTPNVQTGNYTPTAADTITHIYMRHLTVPMTVTLPAVGVVPVGRYIVVTLDTLGAGVTFVGATGVDLIGTLTLTEDKETSVWHHRETNKYVRVGGEGGLLITKETPAGTINGTNAVFTLSFDPDGTENIFKNGLLMKDGEDYTISGVTITFTPAPLTGDVLIAVFNSSGGGGTVQSVSGTTNRVTSTGGVNPVLDVSATFEGLLGKVANRIDQNNASTTSAQLATTLSNESGTGVVAYTTSPTFTTPALGTPSSGVGTNITGVVGTNVTNNPAGNIAATTSQAAINELDTEKMGMAGTTTNDAAAAGNIGQELNSSVSTYTNYSTTATYQNIASVTLTAGDWDVSAFFTYSSNSATITAAANAIFVISTTTASGAGATEGVNLAYVPQAALLGTSLFSEAISPYRVSLSGTTTYYLNSQATFTLGNPQFVGSIRARRIR